MQVEDLPNRLDRWADSGDFGRGPSYTDLRRLASARIRILEAQVAELREALEPFVEGAAHTQVFLRSREKMHPAGQDLYQQDVDRARAALQHKEPQG